MIIFAQIAAILGSQAWAIFADADALAEINAVFTGLGSLLAAFVAWKQWQTLHAARTASTQATQAKVQAQAANVQSVQNSVKIDQAAIDAAEAKRTAATVSEKIGSLADGSEQRTKLVDQVLTVAKETYKNTNGTIAALTLQVAKAKREVAEATMKPEHIQAAIDAEKAHRDLLAKQAEIASASSEGTIPTIKLS